MYKTAACISKLGFECFTTLNSRVFSVVHVCIVMQELANKPMHFTEYKNTFIYGDIFEQFP